MKTVRDTIKEVQYRRLLKHSFEPRKEFMDRSRAAFLEEVAKRRVAPLTPQVPWRLVGVRSIRYTAVFAAIGLLSTSGLVAYADNTNVGVQNPLYSLKRVGEQVRLAVVPVAQQPQIHKELAERRAQELLEVESIAQSGNTVASAQVPVASTPLEQKLRSEFRKNVEAIEEHERQQAVAPTTSLVADTSLCQVAQKVERHGEDEKSDQYKKFEDQCKQLVATSEAPLITTPSISTSVIRQGGDRRPTTIRQEGKTSTTTNSKGKDQKSDESDRRQDRSTSTTSPTVTSTSTPRTTEDNRNRQERSGNVELRTGDRISSPATTTSQTSNEQRSAEVRSGDLRTGDVIKSGSTSGEGERSSSRESDANKTPEVKVESSHSTSTSEHN